MASGKSIRNNTLPESGNPPGEDIFPTELDSVVLETIVVQAGDNANPLSAQTEEKERVLGTQGSAEKGVHRISCPLDLLSPFLTAMEVKLTVMD